MREAQDTQCFRFGMSSYEETEYWLGKLTFYL